MCCEELGAGVEWVGELGSVSAEGEKGWWSGGGGEDEGLGEGGGG